MNRAPRYSLSAISLHWLIAILVFVLLGMGWYMIGIPKRTPPVTYYYNLHKSLGICVAILIALQIILRLKNPPPALPATLSAWQIKLSHIGHVLLYVCLVVIPVSGFISSNSRKFGVKFFGYQWQPLLPDNTFVYELFNNIHAVASYVLAILLVVHILAALVHLFDRSGVFRRMLP